MKVSYMTGKAANLVTKTQKYWMKDLIEHRPTFIDDGEIEYWNLMACCCVIISYEIGEAI